jgi:hypothetical protein
MQVRKFSELFLREAPLAAERPQASPEQNPWIRTWHHGIMRSLTTMSLHTISVILLSERIPVSRYRSPRKELSVIRFSILTGIIAFVLWCITDTSLRADHTRDGKGRITIWGVLSLVIVQIILWMILGFFTVWAVSHLPRVLVTGWRAPIVAFASGILQWFALFMVLQYIWMILRATLSTAFVGIMAVLGFQWARQSLNSAPSWLEHEIRLIEENQSREEALPPTNHAVDPKGESPMA